MKLYISTVFGSTSKELEPSERWVWVGFLTLAGDSQWDGIIKATDTIGYSDDQLADLLSVDLATLRSAKRKMVKFDKIEVDEKNIITILNWEKYQSEYDRQKKYRDKSYRIKLQAKNGDKVIFSSPSISYDSFLSLIEDPDLGWHGITDADMRGWGQAYPACDLPRELAAMIEWIKTNPRKGKKKDFHAFIVGWLARSQKSGGGYPSNKPRPAVDPLVGSRRRSFEEGLTDAGRCALPQIDKDFDDKNLIEKGWDRNQYRRERLAELTAKGERG